MPSGDTAKVYLCPHPTRCDVVAHWNGQARRAETCASVAETERLAMEWWVELYSPPKKPEPPHEPQNQRWFYTPPGLMWAH